MAEESLQEERVPVRRALVGCLLLAVLGLVIAGLVRPAIYLFAPPRDDDRVIVATLTEADDGPIEVDQLLSDSYGLLGERDAGDGRVQVRLIVAASSFGDATVLNAASPLDGSCPVTVGADRLTDCAGRAWTFAGLPLDAGDPPLQAFAVSVEEGRIVADLTEPVDP
jgi:hypothetical protein